MATGGPIETRSGELLLEALTAKSGNAPHEYSGRVSEELVAGLRI